MLTRNEICLTLPNICEAIDNCTKQLIEKNQKLLKQNDAAKIIKTKIQTKKDEVLVRLSTMTKEELKEYGSNEAIRQLKINQELEQELLEQTKTDELISITQSQIKNIELELKALRDKADIFITLLNNLG